MTDTRIQAGRHVIDPINPKADDIYIEDICAILCKQCRFAGSLKADLHYSVGEHCLRASYLVPKQDARTAFGHDWSEAYLLDVPSPLKNALFGDLYREVEDRLMTVIADKFEFEWPVPASVKWADVTLLHTEHRDLMDKLPPREEKDLWTQWLNVPPLEEKIVPLSIAQAMQAFMIRYHTLFERS